MSYPVQLELSDRLVVVVGGGSVAARRLGRLVGEGARARVIAPELADEIRAIKKRVARERASERVDLCERPYRRGDLDGAFLAFAATDCPDVNRTVAEEADERGVPVNVADGSAPSDFSVPAVAEFERLRLAIDSGGASPALVAALRRHLEENLDGTWDRAADILARLREDALEVLAPAERRELFREMASALPEQGPGGESWVEWMRGAARRAGLSDERLDWRSYVDVSRSNDS